MPALDAERRHQVARKARLTQSYPADHPLILEVDRELATLRLSEYIEKTLAEAPPLTDQQRTTLAELLTPVRRPA
jgi:hypothetical protein